MGHSSCDMLFEGKVGESASSKLRCVLGMRRVIQRSENLGRVAQVVFGVRPFCCYRRGRWTLSDVPSDLINAVRGMTRRNASSLLVAPSQTRVALTLASCSSHDSPAIQPSHYETFVSSCQSPSRLRPCRQCSFPCHLPLCLSEYKLVGNVI